MAGNLKQKQKRATPSYEVGLDTENVTNLRRSLKAGYIPGNPVSKDQHGRLIAGRHREATGEWPEEITIPVEDDAQYWLYRFQGTTQRRSTQAEHMDIVSHYCDSLAAKGWSNARIVKHLLSLDFYGESYMRALIPTRYKDPTKATAGRQGGLEKAANLATMTVAPGTYSIPQVTISREGDPKAVFVEKLGSDAVPTSTYNDFSTSIGERTLSHPPSSTNGWIPALCPHCLKAIRWNPDGTVSKAG